MPASFWIFLIICIASFVVAIDDHSEEWDEFKELHGAKKWWKGLKIFTLWFVCGGSLIGTLVLGWESSQDGKKDVEREKQYTNVTNELAQVTFEYNNATNALVEAQKDALLASNSATSANNSAQNMNRHLTYGQKVQLLGAIKSFPSANFACFFPPDVPDAVKLGNDFFSVFGAGGWKLSRSGDIGVVLGLPNGIAVESTENNGALVSSIVNTLNSMGMSSTAFTNVFSIKYPAFMREYLAASNEVVFFIGYKPQ
jgi:hypothetical protein